MVAFEQQRDRVFQFIHILRQSTLECVANFGLITKLSQLLGYLLRRP